MEVEVGLDGVVDGLRGGIFLLVLNFNPFFDEFFSFSNFLCNHFIASS